MRLFFLRSIHHYYPPLCIDWDITIRVLRVVARSGWRWWKLQAIECLMEKHGAVLVRLNSRWNAGKHYLHTTNTVVPRLELGACVKAVLHRSGWT